MGSGSSPPSEQVDDGIGERVGDAELGTRVSRGLGWSLLGQGFGRIGVFVVGIALARILQPIDMGEVAAAFLVVNIAMSINELGVIPALVRCTTDVKESAATATTIAAVNSVVAYVVAFLVAPVVADVTNTPGSVTVIRIMALTVLVDGAIAVPLAMLLRRIRTVPQVVAEVAGMVLYGLVAIGLAKAGAEAESIAIARVVGSVVTGAVIVAVSFWPARPAFDLGVARRLLAFGFPLALSAAIFEAVMSVDYLIVGRELSGAALGIYLLAFNLSSWPVTIVATSVERVSFAGYAALVEDHPRFVRGVTQSFAVALAATLPLIAILIAVAPETVEVLYGSTWSEAAAPLRWLLVIGGLRVLLQLAGEVIAVSGRPVRVLGLRFIWLLLLPVALQRGADWGGLAGVGIGHVVVATLVVSPLFLYELSRCGIPLRPLLGITTRPLIGCAAALGTMLLTAQLVDGHLARLAAIGAIGAITYTAVVLPANPVVRTTWAQLRGRRGMVSASAELVV